MSSEERNKIGEDRFATLTAVEESDRPSKGLAGTFKVSDADFGDLESTEVVRNIQQRDTAEQFAEDFAAASQLHNERSQRARTLDEQEKAPLTTDLGKWSQDPSHWDFPGVDSPEKKFDASRQDSGLF